MTWFIQLANKVGGLVFAWLGPLTFIAGLIAIFGGIYGLWQSANPRSAWFNRKWTPWCVMMCGFLLIGFVNLMNLTGTTLGTTGTFANGVSAYEQIDPTTWSGLTPAQAFVQALGAFRLFWASMGASVCYRAILAAIGVAKGTRRHGWGVPAVLFISGSLVIRLDQVAQALVNLLPNGA